MIDCRPVESPMNPNQKLTIEEGKLFSDPERYRRLVGKLIYLTITRPDLSFAVGIVSQFMQTPCLGHWNAIIRILRYLKKALGQGLLGNVQIFGYCDAVMLIGQALLLTDALLRDIVSSLEEMLSLGKVRSKM